MAAARRIGVAPAIFVAIVFQSRPSWPISTPLTGGCRIWVSSDAPLGMTIAPDTGSTKVPLARPS